MLTHSCFIAKNHDVVEGELRKGVPTAMAESIKREHSRLKCSTDGGVHSVYI